MDELISPLLTHKYRIADVVTEKHFRAKPELEHRYGTEGRKKCREDALYHLNYLIDALKLQSVKIFTSYLVWMNGLLEARHIPTEDLSDQLRHLKEACREVLEEKKIDAIESYIDQGLEALRQQEPPTADSNFTTNNPLAEQAQQYLDYLLEGDKDDAYLFIKKLLEDGTDIGDIYQHIFSATQKEVGRLWYMNRISVATEHFATSATRQIMGKFYSYIYNPDKNGLRLISSTVSSDLHEVGIQMVTDFFEMEGWDTYYLGANMPADDLIEALQVQQADLLALSITIPYHVSEGKELIESIRATEQTQSIPIMVGGYPFGLISDLWKRIGADGTANNAEEAIQLAYDLVRN